MVLMRKQMPSKGSEEVEKAEHFQGQKRFVRQTDGRSLQLEPIGNAL